MVEQQVEVKLKSGLQARQAALFVQEANRYHADVFLQKGTRKVNAKSIMGIMSLAVAHGTEITLFADGKDEQEAIAGLRAMIESED
ncbi:MAG: HPr family phosphocarrier protein [Kurthia gibsonii]|uniref:HPr family phosphocarrier protein n=1 Tax=Kurthia TaxID=1649 RepID=UPI000745EC72|nr:MULTISPECIES: HPr family phosphocarrier protein [Kurthia]AMA62850.1 HPr-like protein crh [Kurthia sp. 11kri321]MEB6113363.1 HPr family phosphocarrier protein [Kurthia gibsonii]MEB7772459.1 HPr family phosphocarrier protein [Kurthia gibsonii]RXH52210.1 HPr family phosphocarrier protein [Kurthia gibsonii]WIL38029.1 HPr family phosphocarrier protein [Kurthia sp. YJT4]